TNLPRARARACSLGGLTSKGRERTSSSSDIGGLPGSRVVEMRLGEKAAAEPAARAGDPRADGPDRHADRERDLVVGEIRPPEQEQRLALAARKRAQRAR